MARPNLVYILADDMGYGDLACQNPSSKIPTPNLDRLAAQGRRFTDAHAPSSVCSPTRYAILTGRYAWRGKLKTSVLWPWDAPLIEAGRLTVPAMLRDQGYATACIGKWHLGWDWATKDGRHINDELGLGEYAMERRVAFNANIDFNQPIGGGPTTRGFDSYFGDDVPNFPPYVYIENDRCVGQPTAEKPKAMFGAPGPMLPGWTLEQVMPELTRRSVAYLEDRAKRSQEPLFLYFPLTAPHTPIAPLERFKGRSQAGLYGDYVVEVDWAVGQIVDTLARTGLAENTLLVFTSDNGPENSAYPRIQQHRHYSMGPLRGLKRDTWEGGHRVPFIAHWPGTIPAGTTCDEVICLTDLMASMASLVGARLPDDAAEDSFDILPALLAQAHDGPLREATVHHAINGSLAIRQGNWVFIDHPSGDANKEPEWFREERGVVPHHEPFELFNLSADLAETRNLYAEHPDKAHELKALLDRYRHEGRSAPRR